MGAKKLPKTYDILFYDDLGAALSDCNQIKSKAQAVEQLNLIIRADYNVNDEERSKELAAVANLYFGKLWAKIHENRIAEGWYQNPQMVNSRPILSNLPTS